MNEASRDYRERAKREMQKRWPHRRTDSLPVYGWRSVSANIHQQQISFIFFLYVLMQSSRIDCIRCMHDSLRQDNLRSISLRAGKRVDLPTGIHECIYVCVRELSSPLAAYVS